MHICDMHSKTNGFHSCAASACCVRVCILHLPFVECTRARVQHFDIEWPTASNLFWNRLHMADKSVWMHIHTVANTNAAPLRAVRNHKLTVDWCRCRIAISSQHNTVHSLFRRETERNQINNQTETLLHTSMLTRSNRIRTDCADCKRQHGCVNADVSAAARRRCYHTEMRRIQSAAAAFGAGRFDGAQCNV